MTTLALSIDRHARVTPNAVALVCAKTGARTTYADLAERSARMAAYLASKHDVGRGARVAVLANGAVRTFEILVAASRLGAVLAPLNVRLADRELEANLAACRPRVLFVDEAHATRALRTETPRLDLETDELLDAEPLPSAVTASTAAVTDPLVVLFTSGSTGRPKGALLTERSIFANATSTKKAWELGPEDVALVDAPLFHTGGLNVFATPLLHAGGTVVVSPRFDAAGSAELLVRERCTVAFGVPTMLERLLETDVIDRGAVRLWVTGGAPCPKTLLDAYRARGARLVQGFGMTECGPNCFRPLPDGMAAEGSIGIPTFGLETRLVRPDGADVAPNEPGELLLKGPHVFAGYLDDPEATRAALNDGWLRSGDVLRATNEGWFVVGRVKEMYISGGENVFPAEVEIAIAAHDALAECAVVGVPDPKWGEAGVAFVVPRSGQGAPSTEDLRAFVRSRLAGYKVPRAFVALDELPRTATGKIDKRALVDRAISV